MLQLIQQLLVWISQDPNRSSTVYALGAAAIAGIIGWLSKRPLVNQAVENKRFLAQIQGYRQLVENLQARITYYDAQLSIRDTYEEELIQRIRRLEEASQASAVERRWRHLVNALLTSIVFYRRMIIRHRIDVPSFSEFKGFEQFEREGGEAQPEWKMLFDLSDRDEGGLQG